METTTRTTITATDATEFPEGVELPWEPDPCSSPIVEDGTIRYLVHDAYSSEYDFPEGVEFVQSNSSHMRYERDIEGWLEEVEGNPNLDVFSVGVYQHGGVSYTLAGESLHSGDQWDYCVGACIAVPNMNDGKGFTDTKEAARAILEEYTSWCNGDVYIIVSVPIANPDTYESVGGYIGLQYAEEVMKAGGF